MPKLATKKIVLFVLAAVFQVVLCSYLSSSGHAAYAGETPEPGTILLLGLGALMLRKANRKNKIDN